jgi:hypothetical protein
MDLEQKKHLRERLLLSLVGIMAVVANLPPSTLDSIGIARDVVMAVLGLVVFIALFLYVRFFFFLIYLLLAVGANLPDQWASALNIAREPLLMTLVCMVALSMLNYAVNLMPTGLEPRARKRNPEGIQVLLNAIERRNLKQVRSVLSMEFEINDLDANGEAPLMRAVTLGEMELVDVLLAAGADPEFAGPHGTALEISAKTGHTSIEHRLLRELEQRAKSAQAQAQGGKAIIDSAL